jgi:hypothetical protein
MLELGKRAKDKITGFEGILVGRSSFLTGCDQFLLQPEVKKDNSLAEPHWFDEGRLTTVRGKEILPSAVRAKKNGCDYSAPKK